MSAKNNVHSGFSSRAEVKILYIFSRLLGVVVLMLPVLAGAAEDDWAQIENEMALQQQALEINEGELQLLDNPPGSAAHYHDNRLLLTEQSLKDGWLTMYQCHSDLDSVHASQIVYQPEHIRNIKVMSVVNIGHAEVDGNTVQMTDIAAESKICISADKRALSYEQGSYHLRLGPFMRRFLDGYYPMRVRVEVNYPASLKLIRSSPVKARQHTRDKISSAVIDIWVVGKLDIELVFNSMQPNDQ